MTLSPSLRGGAVGCGRGLGAQYHARFAMGGRLGIERDVVRRFGRDGRDEVCSLAEATWLRARRAAIAP
jgi:hypothetical protein